MTILLVGEYYSENIGDPLLCKTVQGCIEEAFPKCKIIPFDISGKVSASDYYVVKKRTRVQKFFSKFAKKYAGKLGGIFPLLKIYKNSASRFLRVWCMISDVLSNNEIDLVVFAGGEMFMDYFSGPIYILLKKVKNISVIFHACGMKNLSKDSCKILGRLLRKKNVKSISLRDSYNSFLEEFKIPLKTFETYDTALLCSKFFADRVSSEIIADVGVGLIYDENYIAFQSNLVDDLIASTFRWKIFTNGNRYDYRFAYNLLLDKGIPSESISEFLCERPTSVAGFIRDVTSFERIISFRMHSQICALSYGIPSYGFVWDLKVQELYEKIGLKDNYCINFDNYNLNKILCLLETQDEKSLTMITDTFGEKSKQDLINGIRSAIETKRS